MLFLISFIIVASHALFFTLPGRIEKCIQVQTVRGADVWGAYVISGEGDTMVISRVHQPDDTVIWQNQRNTREGSFEFVSENGGIYKLCFRALDAISKTVSFEFTSQDKSELKALAKEEELAPLSEGLVQLTRELDKIYRNIHFYERREKVHRDLSERTCERVLWTSVIKMGVLASISGFQIYMLKSFFNSNAKTSRV